MRLEDGFPVKIPQPVTEALPNGNRIFMYRALRQMEKDGVVESSWETARPGPARRMYTITDAGEAYLGFWARSLGQYQRSMDAFFRLYAGKPPHKDKN